MAIFPISCRIAISSILSIWSLGIGLIPANGRCQVAVRQCKPVVVVVWLSAAISPSDRCITFRRGVAVRASRELLGNTQPSTGYGMIVG